ncbi:hypothetical protein Caci_4939 [Catenulispora acidiphila DSM 44928]|uniref:Uncharacterized protein n=1 Tax=Catenulispora acidiphila (strain DSM 44928 / JCM 14897 / NBRC 102108 / NRRL B-24433 / ID139908) TaxID=479433 RepID=C7Q363_CATAD|nr:hypothetical protein [Catenulispora acidiphila]ACU73799.1 hypothetical protein Caci_4939 [Catenulispora acidiphila DSM 44928]
MGLSKRFDERDRLPSAAAGFSQPGSGSPAVVRTAPEEKVML